MNLFGTSMYKVNQQRLIVNLLMNPIMNLLTISTYTKGIRIKALKGKALKTLAK